MMRILILALISVVALAACSEKSKRVYFDGKYFPTKAKSVKGDRERFVVNVRRASQSLKGAREAGRHAGVKYCIETFGSSDIDWIEGPDAEDGTLRLAGGNLVLTGQCGVW